MSFDDMNNVTLLYFQNDLLPDEAKVLVLEDNAVDCEVMERIAAKSDLNLDFHFVVTLEELKEELERCKFDLTILDYNLPDGTGLDALKIIDQSVLNRNCASIMVASQAEITIAVAAMKSGCSDYILKNDLTPATLRRTIVNALQKAMLRAKVNDAGRKLVTLRAAVREHSEMSISLVRPLLTRSLAQISALEFARQQTGQSSTDLRLDIVAENCRDILKICDVLERDGTLTTDSLGLPSLT